VKRVVPIICALCLATNIGANELNFGTVTAKDIAANDFFAQGVDFAINGTNTSAIASGSYLNMPADVMMDFAKLQKIEYPRPFNQKEQGFGEMDSENVSWS